MSEGGEKLHKVLADHGLGSRREMERWITAGRVKVDGEPAQIGQRVSPEALIEVDGKAVRRRQQAEMTRVLVMNKAVGRICSRRDPEGRPTVFDDLPRLHSGRWVAVGRLDVQTSGLLLLTNDGRLANKLMHPSTGLDREYAVRVDGQLSEEDIDALKAGVLIDDVLCRFSDLQHYDGRGRNHWYHAVLLEGRNHEVRNLFAALDRAVSRLKRVRYGPVALPSHVREGRTAEMSAEDVKALCALVDVPYAAPPKQNRKAADGPKKRASMLLPYPKLGQRAAPEKTQ